MAGKVLLLLLLLLLLFVVVAVDVVHRQVHLQNEWPKNKTKAEKGRSNSQVRLKLIFKLNGKQRVVKFTPVRATCCKQTTCRSAWSLIADHLFQVNVLCCLFIC